MSTNDNKKDILLSTLLAADAVATSVAGAKLFQKLATKAAVSGLDLAKVKKLLKKIADSDERVLVDPSSRVVITAYEKGTITFCLRAWCKNENYWDLFFDLQENIKEAFDLSGIVLPYEQIDVHTDDAE